MRYILSIILCLFTSISYAELYNGVEVERFEGRYVRAYEASSGFIRTLQEGIPLYCRYCTKSKSIIIYVLKNEAGEERWFWTMEADDAMNYQDKLEYGKKELRVMLYDKTYQRYGLTSRDMDEDRAFMNRIANAPEIDFTKTVAIINRDLKQIEYEEKHPPKTKPKKVHAKAFSQEPPPDPKPQAELDAREQAFQKKLRDEQVGRQSKMKMPQKVLTYN